MASVSALARMYQQRIPTGPTTTGFVRPNARVVGIPPRPRVTGVAPVGRVGGIPPTPRVTGRPQPKVGPRGATAADLANVARFGLPALPRTTLPEVTGSPFQLPAGTGQQVAREIIGQPGPGYGQKYGGFATASQYEDAILGEALGAYELANLAKQQAEAARDRYATETAGRVAERLKPIASYAGVRPGAALSTRDRERLATAYGGVRAMGETPEYQAAREAQAADQFGLFGTPQVSANQLMRQTYEQMLAGGALPPEQARALSDRALTLGYFPEEVDLYNRRAATDPNVAGPEQLAALIQQTPLSQYAQQIAVQRYGMDPNLAAGMFGPQVDLDYKSLQEQQQMADAGGTTVGQVILNTYGPEAYQNWMLQKADEALYGTQKEQQAYADELAAEQNRQLDEQYAAVYGVYPEEFGNIPADEVRQRFGNPAFQDVLSQSLDKVGKGEFNLNVAEAASQQWMTQTGDRVGARILQEAIAKFDFGG